VLRKSGEKFLRLGNAMLERQCLALALYHEARGEPLAGQIAVAATILNRVASRAYPDSICGVVFEGALRPTGCQFTFTCDRRSDMPRNLRVYWRLHRLSGEILAVSRGEASGIPVARRALIRATLQRFVLSTHYHRHDVYPSWSRRMGRIARIGNHVFFRSHRVLKRIPDEQRLTLLGLAADAGTGAVIRRGL
jgi:spore germination cell wall hydrolase CwlJ-like protein